MNKDKVIAISWLGLLISLFCFALYWMIHYLWINVHDKFIHAIKGIGAGILFLLAFFVVFYITSFTRACWIYIFRNYYSRSLWYHIKFN